MNMLKMGAHLILDGITLTGKNRIAEHGTLWNVIGVSSAVKALNNIPGVLIQSFKDGYVRWIGADNDTDFKILSNDNESLDSNLDVLGS